MSTQVIDRKDLTREYLGRKVAVHSTGGATVFGTLEDYGWAIVDGNIDWTQPTVTIADVWVDVTLDSPVVVYTDE